ncbi:MAG: hypothetical protein AAF570_02085 [Bacteroidota bacterium]
MNGYSRPFGSILVYAFTMLLLFSSALSAQTGNRAAVAQQLEDARQRADSLWYFGTYAEAVLAEIEVAREVAEQNGWDDLYVLSWCDAAEVHRVVGENGKWRASAEKAWDAARKRLKKEEAAYCVAMAGYCTRRNGWTAEVSPAVRDSLEMAVEGLMDSPYRRAAMRVALQTVEYDVRNFQDLELCKERVQILSGWMEAFPLKEHEFMFDWKWVKAWFFREAGNLTKAKEVLMEGAKLLKTKQIPTIENRSELIQLYGDGSLFCFENLDFQGAMELCAQVQIAYAALKRKTRRDSMAFFASCTHLGASKVMSGSIDEGLKMLDNVCTSIRIHPQKSRSDSILMTSALNTLATMQGKKGDFAGAQKVTEECIEIYEKLSRKNGMDTTHLCAIYQSLTSTLIHRKQFMKALEPQKKAFRMMESKSQKSHNDSVFLAIAMGDIAVILGETGEFFDAIEYVHKAIDFEYQKSPHMCIMQGKLDSTY